MCSAFVYCSLTTHVKLTLIFTIVKLSLNIAHPHHDVNFGVAMHHPEMHTSCIVYLVHASGLARTCLLSSIYLDHHDE